jgi:hypothetical protein
MDIIKAVAQQTNTNEADWVLENGPETGVGVEHYVYNDVQRLMAYVCVDQDQITSMEIQNYDDREPDADYDGDGLTDVEADAMTLASAGMGTDEDYGLFHDQDAEYLHDHLERDHDEPYIPEQE